MRKGHVVVAAALVLAGCAAMRAARARHDFLDGVLNQYSYHYQPEQVLPTARQVLVERGFVPRDVGVNIIETDWASRSSTGAAGASAESWKYVVAAVPLENGCKLTVMRKSETYSAGAAGTSSRTSGARDVEVELEIMRRLDPQTAQQFNDEAERRATAAANQ